MWATASTRDTVLSEDGNEARDMLEAAALVAADGPTTIDLGGRQVAITPYAGHTASDIVATVDDVTFCGDLLWTGLVPNYVHATPIDLDRTVDAVLGDRTATMVPGHGPLPDAEALDEYRALLDAIEAEGRRSFAAGQSPEEAAASFPAAGRPRGVGRVRVPGAFLRGRVRRLASPARAVILPQACG